MLEHDGQPAVPTRAIGSETNGQGNAGKSDEGFYSFKLSDALLVVFTALLAAFTGFLWWSTAALARETERGGEIAERASRTAEASARAAERTAEIAAYADDARWVVSSMSIKERIDLGARTEYRIVATLKNCGRTSAEITHKAFYAWLAPEFAPATEILSAHTVPSIDFDTLIEPGQTYDIEAEIELTEAEANALCDGSTQLWAWGALSYRTYLDRNMAKGFVGTFDKWGVQDGTGGPARDRVAGKLRPPPLRLVREYIGTVPDPDGQAFGVTRKA
ncbi:hypothetical protein BTH42_00715 [Burkholderia sp. SRS-W-2-2016]|nr:hypothetical protein BTH42_00715 [Burkholderia sp. SRS-W-2-2016]